MQRLLAFIENNLYFILFLVLQAVCAALLFKLNPYQQSVISNSATNVTARVNNFSTSVKNYFGLNQQNILLQNHFIDSLNDASPFMTMHYMADTFAISDSLGARLFDMVPAQVVYNSVNRADNVIVINKGSKDNLIKGSGVISAQGIVGVVTAVGENFSTVMSVLNTNFRVIPQINGQEFYTDVIWNNQDPYTLSIKKINRLENVKEGDLVSTGKSSLIFPPGIPIGYVKSVETISGSQYFNTQIVTATNFRDLHYVFVIKNNYAEEINELLEDE